MTYLIKNAHELSRAVELKIISREEARNIIAKRGMNYELWNVFTLVEGGVLTKEEAREILSEDIKSEQPIEALEEKARELLNGRS